MLAGFGVSYFLIKSLSVELNNKWLRLALGILMLGGSSVMTAHMVQYLLLDAELRARIMDNKMFLNVLCCLVVYLAVQVFTKNVGLTCIISHIALMTFAGINYFVYLFRGNEFIFSDLRSMWLEIMSLCWMTVRRMWYCCQHCMSHLCGKSM